MDDKIKKILPTKADVTRLYRDAIPVDAVAYHSMQIAADGKTVSLKWKDPRDKNVGGVFLGYWAKTTIGAKRGSAPVHLEDCDVTLHTETGKPDKYEHNALVVELENAKEYTIKAFPETTNGAVNESADNVFRSYWLFGFTIDDSKVVESEKIEYTDDNRDFTPAHRTGNGGEVSLGDWEGNLPFAPVPWMMKFDGTLDYKLDPNNYARRLEINPDTSVADRWASDVGNTAYQGNAMNVWEKPVFWKCTLEGKKAHYQISNLKLDDGFECWNAKKADGTYGMFAMGLYAASGSSSKTRSLATGGKPVTQLTAPVELTAAQNNGGGWYPTTLPDIQLMRILGILVFKRTNFQDALGTMYVSGASSTASMAALGSLKDKGAFYGEGWDGSSKAEVGTKFFGFENFWGNCNNRVIGCTINQNRLLVKLTPSGVDGTTGSFTASTQAADYNGYIDTEVGLAKSDYSANFTREMHHSDRANMIPFLADASSDTGYCDGCWSSSGLCQLIVGGNVGYGLTAGLFNSLLDNAPSIANWNFGSWLSYHQS